MNRSSVAIALSGALGAGALLFACAGLIEPLFWPAAAASGASSYVLWSYGRRRILATAYGSADPDTESRRAGRRVTAEDWHRGSFEYRPGDPSPSDDEWDDWEWDGPFWREDATSGATADDGATGDRTTDGGWTGGGGWADTDEEPNWWGGWAEETGDTGRGRGRTNESGRTGGAGATGGRVGGRRRDRATGQRQRQVSRTREEAATVLGVSPDAPPEVVREAFRRRAKETHPDCGGDEASFRRVRWAYEQLRE